MLDIAMDLILVRALMCIYRDSGRHLDATTQRAAPVSDIYGWFPLTSTASI